MGLFADNFKSELDRSPAKEIMLYVAVDYIVVISYMYSVRQITYKTAARKALRKMPANTARRIVGKIESYANNPEDQANNVKPLKGRDGIRLRVGNWRVIMHDGVVLEVLAIGPRGGIYT